MVFHSPHAGQRPIHLGLSLPQALQNHEVFLLAIEISFRDLLLLLICDYAFENNGKMRIFRSANLLNMLISELKISQSAVITSVGGQGRLRQHLLNMGLIPGSVVTLIGRAPLGGPLEISVKGYTLSLREDECEDIEISPLTDSQRPVSQRQSSEMAYKPSHHEENAHPGYGEGGRYHSKTHENPLPKSETLSFALIGQQNSGKTTLFNRLTGSNLHVGNFPGATIEKMDGQIVGHLETLVTDLPGIYSLSTYTNEELTTRDFLLDHKPKAIINILDASNIERSLYLTMQLMELEIPMVVALNMMDEVRGSGGSISVNALERELGLPIIPISASKGEGIDELIDHAIHVAMYQERPARLDFCCSTDNGGPIHRCLHGIMHLIEEHAHAAGLPLRFAASRLVEGDERVEKMLNLSGAEKDMVDHVIWVMEGERVLDRHAAMAEMRYDFIARICKASVVTPVVSKERERSTSIDKTLAGKWTGIPSFICILALIFYLSFDLIGGTLQDWLGSAIDALGELVGARLASAGVAAPVCSLVVDGIFGGVGGVLSFLPIIVVLFFFLSMLEDTGYMSRIAYISDSLLRKIGLSGRSIVPMLLGFGCSVPAVMSARSLPSARDRRMTIMLVPFMSCSAKVAIYGFFSAAFFPGKATIVMMSMYLLGIVVAILEALVSKLFHRRSEPAPFIMEIPNYRLPQFRGVMRLLKEKTRDFIKNAFTVIFLATIVRWFLRSFSFSFTLVSDASESIRARIAGLVAPVFAPMGLNDWRVVTALFSGLIAKESVVSTMQVLSLADVMTPIMALPMLVFCLLYPPCVASINAIRTELGGKWALFVVLSQCVIAWVCSLLSYYIFLLFV